MAAAPLTLRTIHCPSRFSAEVAWPELSGRGARVCLLGRRATRVSLADQLTGAGAEGCLSTRVGPVRLVIARCQVDYAGRLTAHLPMATRLIMIKADGSVSIHADDRAYKPLNWMSPPCTFVERLAPAPDGVVVGSEPLAAPLVPPS